MLSSGGLAAPRAERAGRPRQRRPLGIPTFEDKVLQRAVVMLLDPVYERDFLDCSHGFRPGRTGHTALRALWQQIMAMRGCWLIDADISRFFDTVAHPMLREILNQRVGDGVIRQLVSKWLHAGVWEAGAIHYPEEGTPQGGVISPMLSNIYLHEVLDGWFEQTIKPLLRGRAFLVRYADDFVMGFEREEDARRVFAVLPKRFAKYGLTIHPEKTRLIDFHPPQAGQGGGSTFNFLGFTHQWDRSRKGRPYVGRRTMSKRLTRALKGVRDYCSKTITQPIGTQWRGLCIRMRGHYQYYGIRGNSDGLERFHDQVKRVWKRSLCRRAGHTKLSWEWFHRLLLTYPLPPPRLPPAAFI
jgi:RNA-directed DNA polymerase